MLKTFVSIGLFLRYRDPFLFAFNGLEIRLDMLASIPTWDRILLAEFERAVFPSIPYLFRDQGREGCLGSFFAALSCHHREHKDRWTDDDRCRSSRFGHWSSRHSQISRDTRTGHFSRNAISFRPLGNRLWFQGEKSRRHWEWTFRVGCSRSRQGAWFWI